MFKLETDEYAFVKFRQLSMAFFKLCLQRVREPTKQERLSAQPSPSTSAEVSLLLGRRQQPQEDGDSDEYHVGHVIVAAESGHGVDVVAHAEGHGHVVHG